MNALLTFDLVGPMAHFRRFYTNSSSLSYGFPPRTTLMGMLAAIRGWERDTYYDALSLEKARIGVRIAASFRRVVQTVNYVRTKSLREVDGSAGPTQVPVEFLLPALGSHLLRYRVFFTHTDRAWVEEIADRLSRGQQAFPLYLGITECPAWVEEVRHYPPGTWEMRPAGDDPESIGTVLPLPRLREDGLELREGIRLYKDRVPLAFDAGRRLTHIADVLWEASGKPILARIEGELFVTPEERGVFLGL